MQKVLDNHYQDNLPPKKPNKFLKFIKKFLNKRFLYKVLIILITSFMIRYFIYTLWQVNVFTDFTHPISIIYYIFMASIPSILNELINEIFSQSGHALMMDNVDSLGGGNPPTNTINPPAGENIPLYTGDGFTFENGKYAIDDPTKVSSRRFLDPITNRPHRSSYQPYANNLANAMEHAVSSAGITYQSMHHEYNNNGNRFFKEFMQYNYPDRQEHLWWNSRAVRAAIRGLH